MVKKVFSGLLFLSVAHSASAWTHVEESHGHTWINNGSKTTRNAMSFSCLNDGSVSLVLVTEDKAYQVPRYISRPTITMVVGFKVKESSTLTEEILDPKFGKVDSNRLQRYIKVLNKATRYMISTSDGKVHEVLPTNPGTIDITLCEEALRGKEIQETYQEVQ